MDRALLENTIYCICQVLSATQGHPARRLDDLATQIPFLSSLSPVQLSEVINWGIEHNYFELLVGGKTVRLLTPEP